MADYLYITETPKDVSEAKGLHLITQNTPNGQAPQILLEELADAYGTTWGTTLISISTNEQKKEWFLRLNPNGRIPVIVDNNQSPPFPVLETSAQLQYLVDFYDKEHKFSFEDKLEQNEALQWMFFWHGGGAPYQGQVNHFTRVAPEKIPCKWQSGPSPDIFGIVQLPCFGIRSHNHLPQRDSACLRRVRDTAVGHLHGWRATGVLGRQGQGQVQHC